MKKLVVANFLVLACLIGLVTYFNSFQTPNHVLLDECARYKRGQKVDFVSEKDRFERKALLVKHELDKFSVQTVMFQSASCDIDIEDGKIAKIAYSVNF